MPGSNRSDDPGLRRLGRRSSGDPGLAGDDMNLTLRHEVFVTKQIPQSGRGPLPDGSRRMWSPITSRLIMGERDAVLVDPPMTPAQAADVGDWIAASGRELR